LANIPSSVIEFMNRPETVKTLVTASKFGQPHAIVCGSLVAPSPDTVIVGEILMKVSSGNMRSNPKVSILMVSGTEAYEIVGKVKERVDSGPMLDGMNQKLKAMNLQASAVWVFSVEEVYDQGASSKAGTKLV